jgi:hypothetical protein
MSLLCPECSFELKPASLESPEYRACHVCGHETSALAFPACYARDAAITAADLRREEEDASCFYHESKRAANACSQCGRFLCALCSAQIGENILCPNCVVAGEKGKSTQVRLERKRTLYDSAALLVAVLTGLTVSFSIIGGPVAAYLALRYWKRPSSIVRRYQWRKWLALALGLAETGAWAWGIVYLILNRQGVS